MKKEDIYDGITEIREDIVEEAREKKRNRWGFRLGAVAAVVAVAIFVQTVFHPFEKSPMVTCAVAAEAVYPELAPYPEERIFSTEADWEEWNKEVEAWNASMEALRVESFSNDSIADFLQATAPALLSGEDNTLYSPANIYIAMSMLAELSGGDTRQEVLDLLGADSLEEQRSRANALWRNCYTNDLASTTLANSLWMDQEITYVQDTLNTLASEYYASSFYGTMGSKEYDAQLQSWMNEQTGGLLKKQISDQHMSDLTVMALVSTLYYAASWVEKFESTAPDTFHGLREDSQCDFMYHEEEGMLWHGKQFSAYGRELINSGRFYVILPEEGKTPSDLLEDPEVLDFLTDPYSMPNAFAQINFKMPKLDLTAQLDLKGTMEELGVKKVFDRRVADYTPLTEVADIALTEFQHGIRLTVDEDGCVGAAYTLSLLEAESADIEETRIDFFVDRPFLLLLTSQTGIPLFVGAVNQL